MKYLKGLTLVELLVVMVIIALIVGALLLPAIFKAIESAKISETKAEISNMEIALQMYKSDVGHYPILSFLFLNAFYWHLQEGIGAEGWNGPYIDFNDEKIDFLGNIKDPWGKPYWYVKGGIHNGPDYFDLWSCGPDKNNDWGSDDDINNW